MLSVKIASPEGLENAQDMESLGTVLGIQLRHTNAQSPLKFALHENSLSRTLLHYLYTCCTHDSTGLPESCMRRSAYFAHRAEVTGPALSKTAIMAAAGYYAIVQATTDFGSLSWFINLSKRRCWYVDFQSQY